MKRYFIHLYVSVEFGVRCAQCLILLHGLNVSTSECKYQCIIEKIVRFLICDQNIVVYHSHVLVCTRMSVVCNRMSVVCNRMSVVCTCMYSYVTRMYSYVLVWCFSLDIISALLDHRGINSTFHKKWKHVKVCHTVILYEYLYFCVDAVMLKKSRFGV